MRRSPISRQLLKLGATSCLVIGLAACSGAGASPSATASPSSAASAAAGDTITVTGTDYKFNNLPTEVKAGTTLRFKNEASDEAHMIIVVRKNDDAAKSLEELLKNGTEEEQQSMTTMVGQLEAMPGEEAGGTIEVSKPGEYLALCPIPVGSMQSPAPSDGEGMPHFMKGMYQVFTVK
jgi:plastocyanin